MSEAPTGESPLRGEGGPIEGELFVQGFTWSLGQDLDLERVLDAAFDYRGNVLLRLQNDSEVTGYLFNRGADGTGKFVEVFPVDGSRQRVRCDDIHAVVFSGRDTAAGKSWETWVKKYEAKKAAEARGERVESIDLFPDAGEET